MKVVLFTAALSLAAASPVHAQHFKCNGADVENGKPMTVEIDVSDEKIVFTSRFDGRTVDLEKLSSWRGQDETYFGAGYIGPYLDTIRINRYTLKFVMYEVQSNKIHYRGECIILDRQF